MGRPVKLRRRAIRNNAFVIRRRDARATRFNPFRPTVVDVDLGASVSTRPDAKRDS